MDRKTQPRDNRFRHAALFAAMLVAPLLIPEASYAASSCTGAYQQGMARCQTSSSPSQKPRCLSQQKQRLQDCQIRRAKKRSPAKAKSFNGYKPRNYHLK